MAPSGAAAERFVSDPSLATGFRLQGSHGYDITVFATGHRYVTLIASKGSSKASYTVPGRASSERIVAKFGSLGTVSVRFSGSSVKHRKRRPGRYSCKGRPSIRQRGAFSGVIRFKGERGFTAVDSRRAKGVTLKSFRRVCKGRRSDRRPSAVQRMLTPPALKAKKKPELLESTLVAKSNRDSRATELLISEFELIFGPKKSDRFALSIFGASTRERVGRMLIQKLYFELGEGEEMLVSPPGSKVAEATVTIPKPFSGTATYRGEPGADPTWIGSLGVRLPGTDTVPLTGPGFRVGLCRAENGKQLSACENKSLKGLRANTARALLQGSGSQSQAFWDARLSWSR